MIQGEFEVEVIRAHLRDVPDLSRFEAVLADDERARASGYKIKETRRMFTLARGLLRLELAKRLTKDPADIHFDVRPSGKPDIRATPGAPTDWRFSVSHTGPHATLAFCRGADVGIDIERTDRDVKPLEIAKRYFTEAELKELETYSAQMRPRAFLAGWTRKEAVVKARGSTMAESLQTLSVGLDPNEAHPIAKDLKTAPPRTPCGLTTFEFAAIQLIGAVAICAETTPVLRFEVLSGTRFD